MALALVVGVFALADNLQEDGGKFATLRNAQNVLVQSATVAVAALGMTMIIISGGMVMPDYQARLQELAARSGAGNGRPSRAASIMPPQAISPVVVPAPPAVAEAIAAATEPPAAPDPASGPGAQAARKRRTASSQSKR